MIWETIIKMSKNTIKKYTPKLSLSTYHLPNDPEVLEK